MSSQEDSVNKGRNPLLIFFGFALLGAAAVLLIFGGDLFNRPEQEVVTLADIPTFGTPGASAAAPILSDLGGPEVGAAAPNFITDDLDGNPIELSELAGQPVILNFWATWCAPCRLEMPELQATYNAYQDEKLVILAVNRQETPDIIRPYFYDEMQLTFSPLVDESGLVANLYSVLVMPTTYFISPDGIITAIHRGPLTESQLNEYLLLTIPNQG